MDGVWTRGREGCTEEDLAQSPRTISLFHYCHVAPNPTSYHTIVLYLIHHRFIIIIIHFFPPESVNAVAFLMAHGATEERAAERAVAPYEQEWRETGVEDGEFRVLTDTGRGVLRRSIVYPIGEWEEPFAGDSELFGEEPGIVFRNTTWEEHPQWGRVHLTESATPLGWEATQRHVEVRDDGVDVMIVERTFTPKMPDGSAGDKVVSKEIFERVKIFKPMDA